MQVLFTGLYSKFSNNAALKAVVSGMYLTEAIQGAEYPYIVYHLISNIADWTYTEDMENSLIQFSIFDNHNSSTTILDIFEKLKTCYDWTTLTVTGYSSIYIKREFNILTRENGIWKMDVQYRIEVQK